MSKVRLIVGLLSSSMKLLTASFSETFIVIVGSCLCCLVDLSERGAQVELSFHPDGKVLMPPEFVFVPLICSSVFKL